MKTIGILGGMSWESTAIYYRIVNQEVRRRLGGYNSAHVVLESFNFDDLTAPRERGDRAFFQSLLTAGAQRLEEAGADFWIVACNSVHAVTDAVEARVDIPFIHIVDAAGRALEQLGVERVGLLGTRDTMNDVFYSRRLEDAFGIATVVPDQATQVSIEGVILEELVHGIVSPRDRSALDHACIALKEGGAQATLLACTELGLLYPGVEVTGVLSIDGSLPVVDTAVVHARAAVEFALRDG